MTDYTSMTKEELLTLQIENTTARDALNQKGIDIQNALDAIQAAEDAANAVSTMTEEEKAAMQNALNG